jgi:hypothetical protein
MSDVVQKLWGFCHTLRHDGIDYGDYIEQITFLLFLKMADEKGIDLPKGCDWPTLRDESGSRLTDQYADLLRKLGKTAGILGDIYAEAQSRFNNPVNLKKLINLIDETEWTTLGVDVKAEAYEGLLEKAASEGKKGAGQYFTPRVLIQSIVRCMKPDPRAHKEFTICDPACGTGGFLRSHDPQAGRLGRRRPARQLPLRRSGRRGLQDPGRGLRPAHRLAAAPRHVHPLQPGGEGQRRLFQPRLSDRAGLDLRRPIERAGHHEERPPADGRIFCGIREVLW